MQKTPLLLVRLYRVYLHIRIHRRLQKTKILITGFVIIDIELSNFLLALEKLHNALRSRSRSHLFTLLKFKFYALLRHLLRWVAKH